MSRRVQIDLTRAAEDDIADILDFSFEQFGEAARRRYEALVATALEDLREAPLRPTSLSRSDLLPGLRSYHLRHCRKRAATHGGEVGAPRHLVLYEMPSPELVLILRVLHDVMDLERHIPPAEDRDVAG